MESRQIVGLRQSIAKKNSLEWTFWTHTHSRIYEEEERKVAMGQTRAIMQLDVWTMSTGVNYAGDVDFADCRGMSELLSAPPATVDQLKRNHEI